MHLLRNLVYWDLEQFADAVVRVEQTQEGELRASVARGQRRRPRWLRWLTRMQLMHTPFLTMTCVAWLFYGWPRADTPALSASLARMLTVFGLLIVNAVSY